MSGRLLFRFLRFVIRWRLANKLENALEMSLLNLKISYFRDNTSFVVRVAQPSGRLSSHPASPRTRERKSTPESQHPGYGLPTRSACLPGLGRQGRQCSRFGKRGNDRNSMSRRDVKARWCAIFFFRCRYSTGIPSMSLTFHSNNLLKALIFNKLIASSFSAYQDSRQVKEQPPRHLRS